MAPFSLVDAGLRLFKTVVDQLSQWLQEPLVSSYEGLSNALLGTPHPAGSGVEVVFGVPTPGAGPWYDIYQQTVGGQVTLFALVILLVCVQGHHFARIFMFGSPRQARHARRHVWTGALLILAWYWIGVLTLYVVDGFTIGLIPDIGQVGGALKRLLPTAAMNPIVTLTFAGIGGGAMLLLKAILFLRELLLLVYLYVMPFGLAIAYGNLPVVSQIASRFVRGFIPLAVVPLPVALLFRGYSLLFVENRLPTPTESLFQYVTVIALPVLSVYVTWKTFRYAAPLVARAVARGVTTAATVGTVAGAGYYGSRRVAATAARYGPRAGARHAVVQQVTPATDERATTETTTQDRVATTDDGGVPAYRRSENDPGYY